MRRDEVTRRRPEGTPGIEGRHRGVNCDWHLIDGLANVDAGHGRGFRRRRFVLVRSDTAAGCGSLGDPARHTIS